MPPQGRISIPTNSTPTHGVRSMRSEGCLKGQPERKVRHLRSMGQLSPPPNEPLPPLPPRSASRPLNQNKSPHGIVASDDRVAKMHPSMASTSSSLSSSIYSQDLESETGGSSPRNTMLIQDYSNQGKVQFQFCSDAKNTPNLDDLGHLLELTASLKEMGVSFSKNGEMQTYGDPPLNEDVERMLNLGVEYDA